MVVTNPDAIGSPIGVVTIAAGLLYTRDFVAATGLLALGCLAALLASFLYLRPSTRQDYYGAWGTSWLLTATTLSLYLDCIQSQAVYTHVAAAICISLSAVLTFSGNVSATFAKQNRPAIWMVGVAALLGWVFWATYRLGHLTWALVPSFELLALGQVWTAAIYFKRYHTDSNPGSRLMGIAFVLWALLSGGWPFLEGRHILASLGFILTSLLAIFSVLALVIETVIVRTDAVAGRSQMKYRQILEALSDAVFIVDPCSTAVLEANRAAHELSKRERESLIGSRFTELCPSLRDCLDDKSDPHGSFNAVFKAHKDFYLLRADGSMVTCQGEAKFLDWDNRSIVQVQVRQVTDRGRVGDAIRRADKLSALGQLIAGVAHELNNPLAVILARSEILAKRVGAAEQQELMKIHHESDRAARIVKDLLTFVRPGDPQFAVVDINRLVESVLDLHNIELSSLQIQVDKRLGPNLSLTKADARQIEQVFANLVKNATDAMSAQPPPRCLTVSTAENGTCIRICVSDTGPGVAAEIQTRIFDPFFTTKPPGKGTGLGLAICQNIVQDHRGKLWVESEAGKGASFFVELPLVPCAPNEMAEPEPMPLLGQVVTHAGKKTLVVDDDAEVQDVLRQILADAGLTVDVAAGGREALQKIGATDYDAILCDLCMPEMDGEQLYDIVAQRNPQLAARMIFVTGDTLGTRSRRFLGRVVNPWIGKPFNISAIEKAVGDMLAKSPVRPKPAEVSVPAAIADASPTRVAPVEGRAEPALSREVPRPFPIANAPPTGVARAEAATGPRNEEVTDDTRSSTRQRILVVDDEPGIREVMQLSIESLGYEVDTAANGVEAMKKVLAARYDLILSDICMPEMDGAEFYDAVNRMDPDLARRMIFITADMVGHKAGELLARVSNQRMTKPFSIDVLEKLISKTLGQSDLESEPASPALA
jgi:PAS domain S-box-containing protein